MKSNSVQKSNANHLKLQSISEFSRDLEGVYVNKKVKFAVKSWYTSTYQMAFTSESPPRITKNEAHPSTTNTTSKLSKTGQMNRENARLCSNKCASLNSDLKSLWKKT